VSIIIRDKNVKYIMQYNAILFRLQLPMDDNDVSSFIHVNNNYPEDILYNTV